MDVDEGWKAVRGVVTIIKKEDEMNDELIEVRNCAESYIENAKYHLLHGNYKKALSFLLMAEWEMKYIIETGIGSFPQS